MRQRLHGRLLDAYVVETATLFSVAMSAVTPQQASGRELAHANEATLSSLRHQLLSTEREATAIAAAGLVNDRVVSHSDGGHPPLRRVGASLAAPFGEPFEPGSLSFQPSTTGPRLRSPTSRRLRPLRVTPTVLSIRSLSMFTSRSLQNQSPKESRLRVHVAADPLTLPLLMLARFRTGRAPDKKGELLRQNLVQYY